MLTKAEVIKALFDGKKLRRSNWLQANNSYIIHSMSDGGVSFYTKNKLAIPNYDIVFGLHMFDDWEVMEPIYTFQDLKLNEKFNYPGYGSVVFKVVSVPRENEYVLEGLHSDTGHIYRIPANTVIKKVEN